MDSKFLKFVKIVFPLFLCFLLVLPVGAYSQEFVARCGSYTTKTVRNGKLSFYSEAPLDRLSFNIDNSSPSIFETGNHYIFDAVIGFNFGTKSENGDLFARCVDSLVENGFTDEWFTWYLNDFESYFRMGDGSKVELNSSQYLVDKNEFVIVYDREHYGSSTSISGYPNIVGISGLYIQFKVHFDFVVKAPINSFTFQWNPYVFDKDSPRNLSLYGNFSVSDIVSYDEATVAALGIVENNITSSLQVIQDQYNALTSTVSELIDQLNRYWNILLGDYEGSELDDGFSILYKVIEMLDYNNTNVNTIRVYVGMLYSNSNIIKADVKTIVTYTNTMQRLLSGSDSRFYDFLQSGFDLLHSDLITLQQYMNDDSMASDEGSKLGGSFDSANSFMLPEDYDSLGSPSASVDSGALSIFSVIVSFLSPVMPFLVISATAILMKVVLS